MALLLLHGEGPLIEFTFWVILVGAGAFTCIVGAAWILGRVLSGGPRPSLGRGCAVVTLIAFLNIVAILASCLALFFKRWSILPKDLYELSDVAGATALLAPVLIVNLLAAWLILRARHRASH